jgi:hypothetical protein
VTFERTLTWIAFYYNLFTSDGFIKSVKQIAGDVKKTFTK